MDVMFIDGDGRRLPLDHDLLEDLLGDGCLSDLELSDGEGTSCYSTSFVVDRAMKRGEVLQFTSNDVVLVKLKDNRGVLMASNCTGGNQTSLIPRWDKKQKSYVSVAAPSIVLNYNKNMGGVDVLDQLIEYYRTYQKTKKWTVKVLIHFLDLAVVNSWRQYKIACDAKKTKAKDLLWFRVNLADALINCNTETHEDNLDEDAQSLPCVERPHKRYRPALPPAFDKRYDQFGHFPVSDDLSRGRKCRLESFTECFNNVEIEKENLPAVERVKCPECDYILIPCIEEDDEKNIIFDNCIRWLVDAKWSNEWTQSGYFA
ncbi:piggyBac transposable element-derived protein 4-like [Melitaea cinxia]|uniref:piggyBac transposable element-derived protein 4-like n=1 Tax=Melitaea cinxia TaxID=113334 RepID=UPI001E2747DA|nr:piggyBac transposable element-derived protein 4-like [Melitaea cinxia]